MYRLSTHKCVKKFLESLKDMHVMKRQELLTIIATPPSENREPTYVTDDW